MVEGINWLAVGAAGIAFFALGAVWYTVLGRTWATEAGIDHENPGGNTGLIFASALVLELLIAFAIAVLVQGSGHDGVLAGIHFGLLAGVGIATPVMGVNYLFQRQSLKLFFIDAGHVILGLVIVGAIIGAWR